jgi:dachs protein
MDVVRVLAAVLLLGNVNFVDNGSGEVVAKGETELASVARLLGITLPSLFRGITTRTHSETTRGNTQLIKTTCDANTVSHRRRQRCGAFRTSSRDLVGKNRDYVRLLVHNIHSN